MTDFRGLQEGTEGEERETDRGLAYPYAWRQKQGINPDPACRPGSGTADHQGHTVDMLAASRPWTRESDSLQVLTAMDHGHGEASPFDGPGPKRAWAEGATTIVPIRKDVSFDFNTEEQIRRSWSTA